jgi:DNA repair protein RecO (recombination protein O)
MFQPLTQLEIEAIHKDKNTLENIKEAKVAHPYISIPTNIYKSSVTMFLAEVLYQAIQEEEENKELFQFLQTSMLWLDQNSTFANFHLLFLVKLTRFLGFQPHLGNKEYCFFNLLDGEFQVEDTNKYCIYNENSILLKQLLNSGFDQLSLLKLNQNRRKSFVEMLVYYYELHLHGFRKPKSLEVLQQLF